MSIIVNANNVGNFRNKVIDDAIYRSLYGDEEIGTRIAKIKLSVAISLCENSNYTILDFSNNFLRNLDRFLNIKYLNKCVLLNLSNNNIDINRHDNWRTLVQLLRIIPSDGYIYITGNGFLGGTTSMIALAINEFYLFKKLIWLDKHELDLEWIHTYIKIMLGERVDDSDSDDSNSDSDDSDSISSSVNLDNIDKDDMACKILNNHTKFYELYRINKSD
jgi:hypothetical protein